MANKRKEVEQPIPAPTQEEEEEEEYCVETSEDDDDDDDPQEEEEEEEEEDEDEEEEEEESEESKRDSVRKLLEPFGKDQLIEILKQAALQNHSIIDRILQSAENDTIHRKIFIHGLGSGATNESLLAAFRNYGEIEDSNVVTDKLTGKSKGFGFVLFKTRDGASKALKEPHKKIGNRMIACQLASFGPAPGHAVPDSTGRKIYVANVAAHVNPQRLRTLFAKFGEIEEGPLGYDKVTGRLRGFAIFIYKTAEGCNKALEEPIKLFEGCRLQCKRAVDWISKQKGQSTGENVMVGAVAPPSGFHTSNFPVNYAMGLNLGQSTGTGFLNPAALGTSMNHMGYSPTVGRGLSPLVNQSETVATPFGLAASAAYGMQSNINSFSPSVIGNYGSQAALQGLGAYQNAQLGQSSATNIARSQSGIGSLGAIPSYLGR